MRRLARRLGIAVVAAALLYGADYASLRLRIPRREPYATVHVRRFYAVNLKNKGTGYMMDEPEDENCVNSLFPHEGDLPCWYLTRHRQQRIDINAGPAGPWINTF